MEQVSLPTLVVSSLAEAFGVPDLTERLRQAGVPIIEVDGQELIPEISWRKFVGESIRLRLAASKAGAPPTNGHDSRWAERKQRSLERNPQLAQLLHGFISYVNEREPGVRTQQNAWTVTFFLPPDGREAGMKLRASKGLLLTAVRMGEKLTHWVSSNEDFESGLNWLRSLPGYSY